MSGNAYESAARQGKAFKIAMHLHRHNVAIALAERMTPNEWAMVAVLAGCKWDPARNHDETIALTLEKLTALAIAKQEEGASGVF